MDMPLYWRNGRVSFQSKRNLKAESPETLAQITEALRLTDQCESKKLSNEALIHEIGKTLFNENGYQSSLKLQQGSKQGQELIQTGLWQVTLLGFLNERLEMAAVTEKKQILQAVEKAPWYQDYSQFLKLPELFRRDFRRQQRRLRVLG